MQRDERFSAANRVISLGLQLNAVLMVVKLSAGHFGGSEAVFADGLESACDFVAIFAVMIALRIGRRPCDSKHPYGHGKAESIAAIIVALVIFATGAGILYRAGNTIVDGNYQAPSLIAVMAAIVTILVKEVLYKYSVRVGKRLGSPALMAIAKDHRKDAITSVATLAGVTAAFFGVYLMDPLAAGLTAFFIFHIGYQTFKSAANELMDALPPEELINAISIAAEGVEGVDHVSEIRARRAGQYLIVDLKLEMDPDMTVKRSHAIATEVKQLIFGKYSNVVDVMIHVNPHNEEHEDLIRL